MLGVIIHHFKSLCHLLLNFRMLLNLYQTHTCYHLHIHQTNKALYLEFSQTPWTCTFRPPVFYLCLPKLSSSSPYFYQHGFPGTSFRKPYGNHGITFYQLLTEFDITLKSTGGIYKCTMLAVYCSALLCSRGRLFTVAHRRICILITNYIDNELFQIPSRKSPLHKLSIKRVNRTIFWFITQMWYDKTSDCLNYHHHSYSSMFFILLNVIFFLLYTCYLKRILA